MNKPTINPVDPTTAGTVATGYERVRDTFREGVRDLAAGGGAFAAYVDGMPVADLWAGLARPNQPWRADTLAVMMSATKAMVTLSAQILADRGQLDVDAVVATYWPEFAQAGKERVTVRHLLTHTAGVLSFQEHAELLSRDGTGWDNYDAIAAGLAAARPCWEPGTRFGYHAMSYGWLVGELVRRISGQTVGTFFHDNVAVPLGLDLRIGTPAADIERVAFVTGDFATGLPRPARIMLRYFQGALRDPSTWSGQAYLAAEGRSIIDDADEFFRVPRVLMAEIPSGNGTTTARSLAAVYAMLSMGGELNGVRIVSSESVRRFGTEALRGPEALLDDIRIPGLKRLLGRPVSRSLGYLINPAAPGQASRFGPNKRSFGHDGAGGQIGFCDLDNRIAIGYVRSSMTSSPRFSNKLIDAVYTAAGRK